MERPRRRRKGSLADRRPFEAMDWRNGRGERIRTSDPLVPNQVRYQTALRPELMLNSRRRRWIAYRHQQFSRDSRGDAGAVATMHRAGYNSKDESQSRARLLLPDD